MKTCFFATLALAALASCNSVVVHPDGKLELKGKAVYMKDGDKVYVATDGAGALPGFVAKNPCHCPVSPVTQSDLTQSKDLTKKKLEKANDDWAVAQAVLRLTSPHHSPPTPCEPPPDAGIHQRALALIQLEEIELRKKRLERFLKAVEAKRDAE